MKASELIRELKSSIAALGDQEVAFSCDNLEDIQTPIWIDGIGSYGDEEKQQYYILVICGECQYNAQREKLLADEFEGED